MKEVSTAERLSALHRRISVTVDDGQSYKHGYQIKPLMEYFQSCWTASEPHTLIGASSLYLTHNMYTHLEVCRDYVLFTCKPCRGKYSKKELDLTLCLEREFNIGANCIVLKMWDFITVIVPNPKPVRFSVFHNA